MLAAPVSDLATTSQSNVRIYPSAESKSVTEGDTVVDGAVEDVYATMLDYSKWTEIFPDVAKVVVTSKRGPDARVTLIGGDGHRDNLHFHNQPAARMVWFEDTGNAHAEVWAEIMFVPGNQPNTTRVHTKLYADVHGVASLVVGDDKLRRMRQDKVSQQLSQIRRYFRRR